MESCLKNQKKFVEVFSEFKNIFNDEALCEEIENENVSQGQIDTFFKKSLVKMLQIKDFVTKSVQEASENSFVWEKHSDKACQKETDYMSMDRSKFLGRIICQYMTHTAREFKNNNCFWDQLNLEKEYAIPLVQQNGDYFIGFCRHTTKIIGDKN